MSSLAVFAWIAIGAAVGSIVSRLMVGAEDDALRGTAAGMIGGVLGGLGMSLLDPSPLTRSGLGTSTAALAGSLWLTWITCVATSGRARRDRHADLELQAPPADSSTVRGQQPSTVYAPARDRLVDQLLRDAMAHDAGRYDEVGRDFGIVERAVPRGAAPELARLRVALSFWEGWIDARNHAWSRDAGIGKDDWPLLARSVAADLEGGRDLTDARLVVRFATTAHPVPGDPGRRPAARLRAR